jgi:hypothetical protein
MTKFQARQGDVFVERCAAPRTKLDPVPPEAGRVILAHGEATGHAHAIPMSHAALFARGAERFLRVVKPTELLHEEHSPISLSPGTYRVTRQREYSPEGLRTVAD